MVMEAVPESRIIRELHIFNIKNYSKECGVKGVIISGGETSRFKSYQ